MRKFIFIVGIAGLFLSSCQPDITQKAVLPASLENIRTPEGNFEVVTSLLLLQDSVLTWMNCSEEKQILIESKEGVNGSHYNVWKCKDPYLYCKLYKGVLITEDNQLVDIAFISYDSLTLEDLKQNEYGTFVKVKTSQLIQIDPTPGYALEKVFIYEK